MKTTLGEAVEAHDTIKAIKDANEIPILLAWAMGNWFAELAPIAHRFKEQQDELAKKYGKPDPKDPRQFMIPPDKLAVFEKEWAKLSAIEVDLNGQTPLKLEELEASGIKVPPTANLAAMRLFIQQ